MALPIIKTPEFETVLPSTDEIIKFRPFLVKEEKILYIALEGGSEREIRNAIINVLKNCILTPGVEVEKLSSFDVEYLFLVLRGKSVGETINVKIGHKDKTKCQEFTEIEINIDDIKVQHGEGHATKINVGGGIGFKMKYPTLESVSKMQGKQASGAFEMIAECVEFVYDEETVYEDFTREDLINFIENLSKSQFAELMNFFNTMPKLKHTVEFTCKKCGEKEQRSIEGLQNFFT